MTERHQVLLVPGFLGFQRLGNLPYFAEVEGVLQAELARLGLEAQVRAIRMLPTSSLRARAARLADVCGEMDRDAPIHLIGHSTGGLDARIMTTPGASLPCGVDVESVASRVRSIVTISTPHHGTPLASFAVGVHGHRLMALLSALTIRALRLGRVPLAGALRAGKILLVLDSLVGLERSLLDQLYHELLRDLPGEHASAIEGLLDEISDDQSLLEQLTPVSSEVLNASTGDRPGVRYACIVTMAPRPNLRATWRIGRNPYGQITHAIYRLLHRVTANMPASRLPEPTREQAFALMAMLGTVPRRGDNDGFVPTLSQLRGDILHAEHADHLDVMGYFDGADDPRHVDWLATGTRFGRWHFERLWRSVATFIARR